MNEANGKECQLNEKLKKNPLKIERKITILLFSLPYLHFGYL